MPSTGRIRRRLAKMLSDKLGCVVMPDELWSQEGVYRHYDCARWGVHLGLCIGSFSSWDTMTECVRMGVTIDLKTFEISAKEYEWES